MKKILNIKQLRKDEIVRHYQNGLSVVHIAELFSRSEAHVYKILKDSKVSVNRRTSVNRDRQVIEMYQDENVKMLDITVKFGITSATVYNILKKHNVKRERRNNLRKSEQGMERDRQIIEMYQDESVSVPDIVEKLDISSATIYNVLKKSGMQVKRKSTKCFFRNKKIIALYVDEMRTVAQISRELEVPIQAIYKALHKNDIKLRNKLDASTFMKPEKPTCSCNCGVPNSQHGSIVNLYKDGCEIGNIATMLRSDKMTITQILQNHNIKIERLVDND